MGVKPLQMGGILAKKRVRSTTVRADSNSGLIVVMRRSKRLNQEKTGGIFGGVVGGTKRRG